MLTHPRCGEVVVDQQPDVCAAFANGRHTQHESSEPVIEIAPKATLRRRGEQIYVGCRNDANVNANYPSGAEVTNLALL